MTILLFFIEEKSSNLTTNSPLFQTAHFITAYNYYIDANLSNILCIYVIKIMHRKQSLITVK